MKNKLKTFPPHFKGNKRSKGDESSIALIITLCIMSLLLVLVLAFASVTKVEIQTATANRDIVASKFIAQAALQRAIADLAVVYIGSNALTNVGISGTFSQITPSSTTASVTGRSTNFMTDIEHILINPATGQGNTINGSDGIIDYVALPNSFTNFTAGITPQWIGLKDTNGDLIGRIAFVSSGGSLCLNTVGNLDSNSLASAGQTRNTRNQGLTPSEINLVSALMAMGWSYANATNDCREIVNYRYGPNGAPGAAGDDDGNNSRYLTDKIDNDGDGGHDNTGFEGNDEPQEALYYSDETNATSITPVSDDRAFTDLKQLYQATNFSAGMQARFSANFTAVQQFFCTQSPVKMDPSMVNLNDTNFLNNPNAMFESLTNRLNQINAFQDFQTQQVQVAANIVSFHNTNTVAPFSTNWAGGLVVGVGEVPHLNEIVYRFVAYVDKSTNVTPAITNIAVRFTGMVMSEVWYPYTNNFPRPSLAAPPYNADLLMTGTVSTTATPIAGPGFTYYSNSVSISTFLTGFVGAANAGVATNAAQFRTNGSAQFGIVGSYSNDITTAFSIAMTNFNVGGILIQNAAPNAPLDYWPSYVSTNSLTFSNLALTNCVAGSAPRFGQVTGYISFALNDPRVKPSNQTILASYLEYTGVTNLVSAATTLGARNPTNSLNSGVILPLFSPTATNCDDAAFLTGITNKTFYVPKYGTWYSVTELGRVHRGFPWQTIDFKGNGRDGFFLDNFSTWKPLSATGATNYLHGRVNVNVDKSMFPVWAGLFGGMPLWTGTSWVDYTSAGVSTPMTKTSNLVDAMTAAKYPRYEALLAASYLSNMRGRYGNHWPVQASDEQKEWILDHIFNLVSTKGAGNFFTIWAWGQALKGSAANHNTKVTAAETLIVAMVKIDPQGTNHNMKVVYFRYNPDLEFISSPFLDPGPED